MTDIDKEIEDVLDAEERALHRELGEQGLYAQWFSVYRGPQAWIALIMTFVSFVMAVIAFYAVYRAFEIGGGAEAMRWGGLAILLMFMVSFMKVWFWMRMESNRVIREIKRVELQIARLQSR